MKKYFLISLSFVALMLSAQTLWAAELKIAVVDVQQIVQKSPKVVAIKANLEKQFKDRQNKILSAQKDLQVQTDKLNRNGAVMNDSEKTSLQEKIVAGKRDLSRMQEDFQQDLTMQQQQAMQSFSLELKAAINKVATDGKYDLILEKNSVPFASPRIDITPQISKALS